MSQLTCVANATARMDGKDVPDQRIIVASPNGFSVMERTIVAIPVMSYQPIAQFAIQSQNSSAITTDVSQGDGSAISLMIGEKILNF